ncbi:MAG: deoxyribonuclease IV [Desulfobacterales bacterium]|nr:deoxyribonuclease IV [Desulfobacterales bacterium]
MKVLLPTIGRFNQNGDHLKPDHKNKICLLGAHLSIAKGLEKAIYRAETLDCNVLQIFTQNANTWKERILMPDEIHSFKQAKAKTDIKNIASHASYLINLASPDKKKHALAIKTLQQELIRSSMLGISNVVLHPGAHMGTGEKEGIHRIASSINEIYSQTSGITSRLLLETTAGQGSSLGHTFEQLASIIDQIENKNRVGICIDTCHIFAAGYDIRTETAYQETISSFDTIVGLQYLFLIHLNDSKKELGLRVDRHEHIGQGFIGLNAFAYLMNDKRFVHIPKIIETPKEKKSAYWDRVNLRQLRSLIL